LGHVERPIRLTCLAASPAIGDLVKFCV
jgi:hypothetical protein